MVLSPRFLTPHYTSLRINAALFSFTQKALLHINDDIFTGKHAFRRCMDTDQYTKLVHVGALTRAESANFTVPSDFKKTVACPGCYQCREVPIAPNTVSGQSSASYDTYHANLRAGFNPIM